MLCRLRILGAALGLVGCATLPREPEVSGLEGWRTGSFLDGALQLMLPAKAEKQKVDSPLSFISAQSWQASSKDGGVSVVVSVSSIAETPIHDPEVVAAHNALEILSRVGAEKTGDLALRRERGEFVAVEARGAKEELHVLTHTRVVGNHIMAVVFLGDDAHCFQHSCQSMAARLFETVKVDGAKLPRLPLKAVAPSRSGFLWKATWPGSGHESHLFGTVHLGLSIFDLPAAIRPALRASSKLITEVSVESIPWDLVRRYLLLPQGQKLSSLIGPSYVAKLRTLCGLGPRQDPELFTPLFFSMTCSGKSSQSEEGIYLQAEAPDRYLQIRSRLDGRKQGYVETLDEQFLLFRELYTVEALKAAIDSEKLGDPGEVLSLIRIYREGRPEDLWKFIESSMSPEELKILLLRRNQNWVSAVESCMRAEPCFIAVGAAHLVGPGSLIELLKKRGWQISYEGDHP